MFNNYSKEFLQTVLDAYTGLGYVEEATPLLIGIENSNFFIKTSTDLKIVVKVFEGLGVGKEHIGFELVAMRFANEKGSKVPRVFKTKDDQLYIEHAGKIACVMEFVDGQNMGNSPLPDTLVVELAEEVGKMDVFYKQFAQKPKVRENYEWDLKNFVAPLEGKIAYLSDQFDHTVFKNIFEDFKKNLPSFLDQPMGLIHNDIGSHNILARNGALAAIVDFSDITVSPYVQNIAVALAQTVFIPTFKPHQVGLFVSAYQKQNPISNESLALLYCLVLARLATVVLEFNDLNRRFGGDDYRDKMLRTNYEGIIELLTLGKQNFDKLCRV